MLNTISEEYYKRSLEKGFAGGDLQVGTHLMLIVSELAEALEAHRKSQFSQLDSKLATGKTVREELDFAIDNKYNETFQNLFSKYTKGTLEDELADVFIRLMYFVGSMNIDIDAHVIYKLHYNSFRPYKHGKAY